MQTQCTAIRSRGFGSYRSPETRSRAHTIFANTGLTANVTPAKLPIQTSAASSPPPRLAPPTPSPHVTPTDRPAHRPITPRPARGLRADDVSCGQWRATAHRGPAWRDRSSPSRPSPLAQFELRAALIGRRPRRLFLAGYLRPGPPRAGGVGAGRCAAERLSAPAAGPREPVPSSSQSRPRHPGRSPIILALITQARPGYPVRIPSPRSPTPDPGQAAP